MILDKVILHDFGVYAGMQEVTLTPPGPSRPVILFGGLNGAGKTTLMDALQLCLLGPMAQCAGREGEGYQTYLAQCVNRRSRYERASVTVVFRRMEGGEEARYRVARSWEKSIQGVREKLQVTRNKRPDKRLTENWSSLAEEILPPNISHLFFFDGEKVESYASPEGARELVSTGVRNLLGMDLVDRLQKDLVILERRKQGAATPAPELEAIREKEKGLAELQKQIIRLTEDKAQLRSRKLLPARRDLENVESEYRARGGEARDRHEEIARRVASADNALATNNSRMVELADGLLPLSMIAGLLDQVDKQSHEEYITEQAQATLSVLQERDAKAIRAVRGIPDSKAATRALESFFKADINKRKALARREILFDLSVEAKLVLWGFFKDKLPRLKKIARKLIEARGTLNEEAEAARLDRASIPTEESIAAVAEKRDALLAEISRLEAEEEKMAATLGQLRAEKEKRDSELEALWADNAEAKLSHKNVARFVRRSRVARQTLGEFQLAVLSQQIGRVARSALESYQSLLRKERLVSDLQIDPERFDITLRDAKGGAIPTDRLSAGERQLLAVSLLWGMAKASGRVLPVAIDTPMGRLDSEHRTRLVERYFPRVSHQALLFSTDEEIFGDYLKRLRPHIGRSYLLDYDDHSGATSIREGFLE